MFRATRSALSRYCPGAVLTVIGPASVAGLTEVECEGKHYALFQDDLEHRAKQLLKGRVSRYDDLVS